MTIDYPYGIIAREDWDIHLHVFWLSNVSEIILYKWFLSP